MRVLVTGAAGQVGHDLVLAFGAAGHEVVPTTSATLDITDWPAVWNALQALRPELVVNAAAWTAVDACEDDPERADLVNGRAVSFLVAAAEEVGARVCQLSTDYVFDGRKPGPYVEDDEPNPLSVYGWSKLGGERALRPDDLLIRTAWVSGRNGRNVITSVISMLSLIKIPFVDDQRGSPTIASDLAAKVVELSEARLAGTFHVTNQGEATWFEVAQAVMESLRLGAERVQPITTAELSRRARRPANSVLDNAAVRREGIALLPHWRESLPQLVNDIVRGR
ncbi:MAG TPA: dTDP-4-dehydrorhamnose reductase [Acidimicrobiales bacterium]|nr:dTDP-4-dehydrorhamnose reductase [Acidimicrobiales bacterium]